MDQNFVVTQSNDLIEARHNKPLSAREQKIVLTMVSMIEPTDDDFKDYRISIREFSEMLGLVGSTKYTEIKKIAKELMSKTIEIPQDDGDWLLAHWVSSTKYIKGEGIIELSFSPKLKPYMLQLKNQFTSYRLSNILSLNSTYSIRLYELMKKWQHLGKWGNSVEELKLKFGVTDGTYNKYNHFKTRVLKRAIDEVNAKTDLYIGFEEIKKGRSVDRIEFTIKHSAEKEIKLPDRKRKSKQPKKNSENEDVRIRLNALADDYNFDQTYFFDIYAGAMLIWPDQAENELKMLIEYINEEDSVKNPLGFIKAELSKAWELHKNGISVTFADKKLSKRNTGKEEIVPDWLKKGKEKNENSKMSDEEWEQRTRGLLKEFGKSDEDIDKEIGEGKRRREKKKYGE